MPPKKVKKTSPNKDFENGDMSFPSVIEEKKNIIKFSEKYNLLTEKKTILYNKLGIFEKNNQYKNVLSLLRELLLIEHGNSELIQKYGEVLKKIEFEDLSSFFLEKLSIDDMSDYQDTDGNFKNIREYEKIESLISEKKYFEAQTLVLENLEEYPLDQFFMYLHAKTFYHKHDFLKSKVILEDILSTNPDFCLARNDLGIVYHECGDDAKAIDCLKYAVQTNNYDINTLKNLADIYNNLEMFEEAFAYSKRIIKEFPDDIETLLGMAELSVEASFFDDAILYLNKALSLDPDNSDIKHRISEIIGKENNMKPHNPNGENEKELHMEQATDDLVSIIILTYNNLFYTRETIKSIKKYTDIHYEIIIIDNNSTDGTVEYLLNIPGINLILNNSNRGFAAGCNQGISAAKGKYILLLNNDVIVSDKWLERLINYFSYDDNIMIVGPVTNYISGPQLDKIFLQSGITSERIIEEGDLLIQQYAESLYVNNKGKGIYFPRVTGFCMLIDKNLIDAIGGFDETFKIGNFEDDDFCLRAKLAGFKAVIATDVFIYHFGSKSFSLLGEERYQEIILENKQKFIQKFGLSSEDIFIGNKNINKNVDILCEIEKSVITKASSEKKSLALCMIVKNESKFLDKCLHSVADIVDEIIIVDTGSTDNTIEIAKKYHAKILTFTWNEDFSAPRNIALENANSEWIMVLDADEELKSDSVNDLLKLISKNEADAYTINILNLLEADSFSKYEIFPLTRLFRNKRNFKYEGIIHEQIKPSIIREGGVIKDSDIQILHYGYKSINDEKINRNSLILEEAIRKEPNNPYYFYQLGITLFSKADNDKAIDYLIKAYELSERTPGFLSEGIMEKLIIKISQFYLQRDEVDLSEKYIRILIEKKTKNPISIYIQAAILFLKKDYKQSLDVLLKLKEELLKNNEQGIDMHQIYIDLGNNYYILENYDEAFLAFQNALEVNKNSYVACYNLGNLLYKIGHHDDAVTMFEWAYRLNPELIKAEEMIRKIKSIKSGKDDAIQ
jgi:GT2 family glycosyltransferase/lipopolysaccharide biosynthesis regulator YciM